MHPGQKNNLDALCRRYGIINTHRQLHGALLDSEILADVYLLMTGGQTDLMWTAQSTSATGDAAAPASRKVSIEGHDLPVVMATSDEIAAHNAKLQTVAKASGDQCLWLSNTD